MKDMCQNFQSSEDHMSAASQMFNVIDANDFP